MKCILLCAGYATRLYPLTKDTPKHLLEVNGKSIIDHILEKLSFRSIDSFYVITNDKFYSNFIQWKKKLHMDLPITIINDHTTSNDDRLGSIGDLNYTIEVEHVDDDFILINADNIFNFSLAPMMNKFREQKNVIALYDVKTKEEASKMGVATVNGNGVIAQIIEKPSNPQDTLCSIGIYFLQRRTLALLQEYVDYAPSLDTVGHFMGWLCQRVPVHAQLYNDPNDIWLDIGTPSQLELARKCFS